MDGAARARLFEALFEGTPSAIWVYDHDGRTVLANEAMAQLYGVTRDEMAHVSIFDTLDATGREQFAAHLADLRRGGRNDSTVEVLFRDRHGRDRWMLVTEDVLVDDDETPYAFVQRFAEYDDRRRTLDALAESERRLAEAEHIAGMGSWTYDPETRVVEGSPGLLRLYGLPERHGFDFEEVVGHLHPDDRSLVEEQIGQVLVDGSDYDVELRVRRGDDWLWTRAQGRVVDDGGRRLLRGTQQDIDTLKRAQLAMEDMANQNRLTELVSSAANQAGSLVEVLALTRDLVLMHDDWRRGRAFLPVADGGGLAPLYLSDAPDDAGRLEDRATPEETAMELELALRCRREGRPVWDDSRLTLAFPIRTHSTVHAVVTLTSDPPLYRHRLIEEMCLRMATQLGHVVEREVHERELAAARDAAMAASRHKSEFLATMSHEIRTPLNGVIGLSDLLQDTELTPEQQRLVGGMQVASRALLSLINDILDFSRIEAGRLELEHVDFSVRQVLEEVAALLDDSARSKGLSLVVAVADDVPDTVAGDPGRLAQVVANLVSNAIKFTERGSVEVRARGDAAESDDDPYAVHVEVCDTGIGVGDADPAQLFRPFTQADSSHTRRHGGTGLGLAISTQVVEALGGEIGYRPGPEGSIFWFTARFGPATGTRATTVVPTGLVAPAVRLSPGAGAERRPKTSAPTRGRVLVVEDNDVNQLVAVGLLEAEGLDIEVADDGAQALDVLARDSFDLVLMDVQMPVLDGYEATRELRRREEGHRRTPVVALTAAATEGAREQCLAAGMDDFLTKPVDRARLREALARWLDGGAPAAEPATTEATVTPSAAGEFPGLDLEHLEELRELSPDLLERIITRFTASAEPVAREVADLLAVGDHAEARARVHTLAGSAGNAGLEEVSQTARTMEEALDAGRADEAVALAPALVDQLDAGRAALLAFRDSTLGSP